MIKGRKMRWRHFIFLLFGGTIVWCFVFEVFILRSISREFFNYFKNQETPAHIKSLFLQAPILEERLFLIDKKMLQMYNEMETKNDSTADSSDCLFCTVRKNQPITFALLCPTNTSLEEHILLPILKAWEIGFWVENIINSKLKKFSTYQANLPLGFILQKGGAIVEIVLLHEREGDFWWHGSFYQDVQYKSKLSNLGLTKMKQDLVLTEEGALDKFQFKSAIIDNIKVNVPSDIPKFLRDSTYFIECNYEMADRFFQTYGKDTTPRALRFIHKARKILSSAKTVLDSLQIPFWISSGTLLGYYRQCDVIPYAGDVDIGVFIKDYNEKLIESFQSARLKLKHKFGKLTEGFELSFTLNEIKLDIFFFYDDGQFYWNGGHEIFRKNNTFGAYKYKYTFPKFTLCWTEFLDMKVRIPCQTETYIRANYGPDWFIPIPKWSWVESPFNVQKMGEWGSDEIHDVIKIFK